MLLGPPIPVPAELDTFVSSKALLISPRLLPKQLLTLLLERKKKNTFIQQVLYNTYIALSLDSKKEKPVV